MFQQFLKKWKTVEKPKEIPTYKKGKWYFTLLVGAISVGLGWLLLFGLQEWEKVLPVITDDPRRYDFAGWAASYFIYMFMMVIPLIIANIFYHKTNTPVYGFATLGGFLIAAATFMLVNLWWGIYTLYSLGTATLANSISQRDYKIKTWHMIYYFILGIVACYINAIIQMHFWDVWVWLQFIHLHLFVVIIASVKIRQWGYMYMVGWAMCAIYIMFAPSLLFMDLFPPFQKADLFVTGLYNFITPPLLAWVVLYYFFKIQRQTRSKTYNPDEKIEKTA